MQDKITKLVFYNKKESTLHLPNEIFKDLQKHVKSTPHIAFAYSYIYFVTWLYRYSKHAVNGVLIDNAKIKEVLGYNPKNQTVNYLIKKDGLLDKIEYTDSIRDIPLTWELGEELNFTLLSENAEAKRHLPKMSSRYFTKFPVKAFHRVKDDEEIEGTFYDVSNTHNIPFEVFLFCMSKKEIGCTGFYLYGYLKSMCDVFNEYNVSLIQLSKYTRMPLSSLETILMATRKHLMINCIHNQEYFVLGLDEDLRKPNTYTVSHWSNFSRTKKEVKTIKVITKEEHKKIESKKNSKKTTINLDNLPY